MQGGSQEMRAAAGQPPEISNSIYHGLHGLTRINARVEAEGRGAPLLPPLHVLQDSVFSLPIILPPHFLQFRAPLLRDAPVALS